MNISARDKPYNAADAFVVGEIQKHYGLRVGQDLGGDWFEHALVERKFWL